MIVKTARAREYSYDLLKDRMVERCPCFRYVLYRRDLKVILHAVTEEPNAHIAVYIEPPLTAFSQEVDITLFGVKQGKTQRGKKFIQIGCKRFVGENRRKLIAWAKGRGHDEI